MSGVGARGRRERIASVLAALRPRQWTKNLLVFAGILFGQKLGDPVRWVEVLVCFAAYCAASSAAYLVNDVRDREADRAHPTKRFRPIANGSLAPRRALVLAAGLGGAALLLVIPLGPGSVALLLAFGALQLAYTMFLKHVAVADVLAISGLFVIRAAAGAVAVGVPISPWLLVCTALLALFLALGKRRAELGLVERGKTPGRATLSGYTIHALDRFIAVVAAATVVTYVLYTLTASVSRLLAITIPFVVFGVLRYIRLVRSRGAGEEPEQVLLRDVPTLVAVSLWAVTSVVVLAIE